MASALDDLTEPLERTEIADPLVGALTSPTTKRAYTERIRAEDLESRGVPTFRNASGGLSAIDDITAQPAETPYTDPFEKLGEFGQGGTYKYDPKVKAQLERKAQATEVLRSGVYSRTASPDKEIAREASLLGRKLTLDERDLTVGTKEQKAIKESLKTHVPTLLDPKYEGADKATVLKAVDEHFNSQYAAPEANETRGWFGSDLSPLAMERRKQIDASKAKAMEEATSLFDLNDQLTGLTESVEATRQHERLKLETLLAHTRGERGPLDKPIPGTLVQTPAQAEIERQSDLANQVEGFPKTPEEAAEIVRRSNLANQIIGVPKTPEEAVEVARLSNVANQVPGAPQIPDTPQEFTPISTTLPAEAVSKNLFGEGAVRELTTGLWKGGIKALASPLYLAQMVEGLIVTPAETAIQKAVGQTPTNYNFFEQWTGALDALLEKEAPRGKGIANVTREGENWLKRDENGKVTGLNWNKIDPAGLRDPRWWAASLGENAPQLLMPMGVMATANKMNAGNAAVKSARAVIQSGTGTVEATKAANKVLRNYNRKLAYGTSALMETQGQLSDAGLGEDGERRTLTSRDYVASGISALAAAAFDAVPDAAVYNMWSKAFRKAPVPVQKEIGGRLTALAKDLGKAAAWETPTEAIQTVIENAGAKFGWDPHRELSEGVFETILITPFLMSVPTVVSHAAQVGAEATAPGAEPPQAGGAPAPIPPTPTGTVPATVPEVPAATSEVVPAAQKPTTLPAPRQMKDSEIETELKSIGYEIDYDMPGEGFTLRRGDEYGVEPKEARAQALVEVLGRRTTGDSERFPDEPGPELTTGPAQQTIDVEAHAAATSPTNALPEPTQAQKEAGNYKKGHVAISGLDISIENPAGSKRKEEYRPLESHYGYIKGTVGADKDHVDVFVKKETPADWSGPVFVVNQVNAKGKFDEHKAVIGVQNQSEALREYNANYQPGWKGAASVVKFATAADFKAWATSGVKGEPVSQTAVRIVAPEGATMHAPQIEGAHVVSTAVKRGEKYLVGSKWNEAHEGIAMRHSSGPLEMVETVKQTDRGFIVQDESGAQRFATRAEAGTIAQKSGQLLAQPGPKGVQSSDLQVALTRPERKVSNLVKGTMAKHRATLEIMGHQVAPRVGKTDNETGLQAKMNRDGAPMITVDPKKLAKITEGMDDRKQSKYVQRAIEEEILHVAALRWETTHPDNRKAINEWGAEKDELETHLAGSYPGWEKLSARQKGHEKVRAVLQKRWTGKLTESATRMLREFLKYLRGIYGKLTPGQRETVDGVEAILKGRVTEAQPSKKTSSNLQQRAFELTHRVSGIAARSGPENAVVMTLIRSGSSVALDQAEKKIAKLEENYASKISGAEKVGVRSEGGSVGEGAPLRQPRKIAETSKAKPARPVGRPSTLDQATQKELAEAFEGLFAGPPAKTEQRAIPPDKIGAFVNVATKLVAQGVDTPQKLASELESLFEGKARPFSQALWDAIGMVNPELRATHDWAAIYLTSTTAGEPGMAAPAMILPQNRDQLIQQVSLSLQTGPVTRRQLTEMAKESGLDVKRVDEAAETGIVMAARQMVSGAAAEISPVDTFDQMVELYDRQPNLTAKTSTSKVDQAYSTPVPLAYAASRLADIRGGTSIYEPTAGNGVLLLEADPNSQEVVANEINGYRLEALSAQGFKPQANDATKWSPGGTYAPKQFDRLIANPPFGTVLDPNQEKKTWALWAKATDQIDHAIAVKALEAMKDDGRAVLILGGKNLVDPDERAKAYIGSENQRNFWPELYRRYNVIDHFTIDGDLYSKQGAGWPVDVIVIAGRGNSKIQLPSAEAPRILTSWSQLRDELSRTDADRIEAGRYNLERDREKVSGIVDSIRGAAESESGIGPKRDTEPTPAPDGGGRRAESVARSVRSESEPPASGKPQPSDVAPARGTGELGARPSDVQPLERGQQLGFRVPYKPASKLDSFGIFVPTNMEAPAREALVRLQERIGPIDEFVRTKLGYPESAPLNNYFSAEQMDALALGIDAIDGETAFVLGDQGGVGKGRVAAGMIAYAKTQGKVPIFITKDEKLYAAMIEDLHDIGRDDVVPVFTNNAIEFEDYSGTKWKQGSMSQVMKELARTGKLPMHADVLFTTYSQIQADVPPNWKASKMERASLKASHKPPPDGLRMEALKKLAPGSVIIADESHLAAGDSIRAWRLSPLLAQAAGVYYSSATFAKRPDSMGIYSRTSLSHATTSMGDLVDAMKQGGVPLQQVVSATLASDGLYLRRERDFSKAVFRTQINVETKERDTMLADNYTAGLRAILNISNKMKNASDYLNKILRREAKTMHIANAPRVESTNFSSKLHNLVSQYLFAIKAEAMVRRAVEGVTVGFPNKDGRVLKHKVIIAVQNTMEQPILALERSARPLNFKGMLLQYLDTQRTLVSGRGQSAQVTRITDTPDPAYEDYTHKQLQNIIVRPGPDNAQGESTGTVNEQALAELFRRIMSGSFKEAEALIDGLDLADMPLSPIDHIRHQLSHAGIKNAEITGRGTGIDEDGAIYKIDPSSHTKAAHIRYMSDFNNGDTDAMVINASGSTGISLHSSKKFKRTDPRAMIIGQPHLDINEFMQTLYRTDRTGQVHQPYYELLQTAIPAELRPAAILNRKMGSLNANTTSNAENEISAGNVGVDIFNQYGDEVVYNYLKSDTTFTRMLDMPKIMSDDNLAPIEDVFALYEEDGQFAAAVTGRVAVLPTAEQEEFWSKVSADYVAKIDYLNELGENELMAEAIDMKAETLDSKELTPAVTGKGRASGFDQPSYLERIKADIGMKPLPGAEVVAMMENLGETAYELRRDWLTRAEAWKAAELKRKAESGLTWDDEKRRHLEARWREQEEEINTALGLIGSGLHLKNDKGLDGYGAITEVKLDDEHPLTPSKQIFRVHVNTTKKMLRVAGSELPSIARMAVGDFADLYESTAERSNIRYMVTGNLLSAYLAIRDAAPSAKIVQYTNDQGELRQGILMPQKFAPGALSKKRVVESASHMRKLLDAGRSLTNADSSVSIVKPSGIDYVMRVPSSRTMGGAYWRDSNLASLMSGGEFVERSGAMIGKFQADGVPKVYQRLLDLNATLFYTEQGEEALGAGKPHRAPAAYYKEDVEPVAKSIGMTVKESLQMLRNLVAPTSGVAMEAHDRVMKMLGERNQKAYETDRVLEAWHKALDKMPRPEQIAFIDKMKTGQTQATPELQDLALTMRKIDTESWDAAVATYSALGFKDKEIPLKWLENHFRVLWKKIPGDDEPAKAQWIGKARRGLRGSMGQHKQHTLETMSDGLAMGGIPYSYNAVEMFKLAQADLWKLTTTLRAWKWAKDHHFVEYVQGPFPKAPDGMVPLNDPIARVYFPADSGEGLVNAGQYFVEEGFGRLLNNHLSTDHIRQTRIGRGLMWIKNSTTSLELSLSPFHAVFETMEMVGSDIGLGLSKLVNRGLMKGDLGAAASGIMDIIKSPVSPFTGWHLGREIRKAAGDPVAYFKTAAGKKMLKTYPRSREFIDDLFTAGWKPNELEQDWKNQSVRTFVEAVADIKAGTSDNYIGAGLRAFPAVNEMLMKPLFDWYIPSLKVAQFFKEYDENLKQNARKLRSGVLTRAALARQVWTFVEDRFGETNFDSLFWNRNFKTAMQLMFRSVTWKLGSLHAFGGAFGGQAKEFKDAFRERRAPELHRNTAWLFGMFLLTATMGAIISRVLGEKEPETLVDYVFPQIDPKDDKVRVSLPTYFKDMVHLVHSPPHYVKSSMSGWIGKVADLLTNKDYFGVQIRDTDDPIVKQALQVGQYTGVSMLPFSVRGYKQLSAQDVSGLRKALAFVAINPAPRHVSQTPAEKQAEKYWRGRSTEAGIKPEQFEAKREKRKIVAQIRHGEVPNISAALSAGTLKPSDVKSVYQRAQMGALTSMVLHMPLADAEKVYQRATLKERSELAGIMSKKRVNAAKQGRRMFTGF